MQPPPLLYHYTDTAGFYGVVESGVCLRATHHRYLNDIGEVHYGQEIVDEILDELVGEIGSQVRILVPQKLTDLIGDGSFIACLSERHAVLSQWRAYAKSGAGYCLGLRLPSRLVGTDDGESYWFNHLVKCTYGPEGIRSHLRQRFRRKIHRWRAGKDSVGYEESLASQLAGVAWRSVNIAKHEHFTEENEWRIIVGGSESRPKYRPSAKGLVPFFETEAMALEEVCFASP